MEGLAGCADCAGCLCCECRNIPLRGCGDCYACQCHPCRLFLRETRGLCCCVENPVVCCNSLESIWLEHCPSGYVGPWCTQIGCPDCCAKCVDCNCCSACTATYWYCNVSNPHCNDAHSCDGQSWGFFKKRGIRIGRLTNCNNDNFCGGVWPCECLIGWTCCVVCSLTSLLAHSQNTAESTHVRPHVGHAFMAVVACPCALCAVRNYLRVRHRVGTKSCAPCRDACACVCCYPCMVAQFQRASYPWEWSVLHPVPDNWEALLPDPDGVEFGGKALTAAMLIDAEDPFVTNDGSAVAVELHAQPHEDVAVTGVPVAYAPPAAENPLEMR